MPSGYQWAVGTGPGLADVLPVQPFSGTQNLSLTGGNATGQVGAWAGAGAG
jgi:hypothetical protein